MQIAQRSGEVDVALGHEKGHASMLSNCCLSKLPVVILAVSSRACTTDASDCIHDVHMTTCRWQEAAIAENKSARIFQFMMCLNHVAPRSVGSTMIAETALRYASESKKHVQQECTGRSILLCTFW